MELVELFPRGEGGEEGRALPENVPFLLSVLHIPFAPPLAFSFVLFPLGEMGIRAQYEDRAPRLRGGLSDGDGIWEKYVKTTTATSIMTLSGRM